MNHSSVATTTTHSNVSVSTTGIPCSGDVLHFDFDSRVSRLDLIQADGTKVEAWEKTLLFAFAVGQSMVRLVFRPVDSSYSIEGSCTSPDGTEVPAAAVGNEALITILQPSALGSSFDIRLSHGDSQSALLDPSVVKILRPRLVLTTVDPVPDPDALPGDMLPPGK